MLEYGIVYFIIVFTGLSGLALFASIRKPKAGYDIFLPVLWSVLFVYVHSKICKYLQISATWHPEYGMRPVYYSIAIIFIGVLVFVYFGLVRLYFKQTGVIEFNINKGTTANILYGILAGILGFIITHYVYLYGNNITFRHDRIALVLLSLAPGAILEESVFRGLLFKALQDRLKNIVSIMILQASIFLLIHLPLRLYLIYKGQIQSGIIGIIAIFIMALIFGWLRYKSKALWSPIAAHLIYNSMIIVILMTPS